MTNPQVAIPAEVEHALVTPPRATPKVEHLEPFLRGACQVLEQEFGTAVRRGQLHVASGNCTTQDLTVIIGITGQLTGLAIFGMNDATALAVVGHMLGMPVLELDDLALSGIAELGNVMSGRAATLLTESGYYVDIAPPVLLVGAGV